MAKRGRPIKFKEGYIKCTVILTPKQVHFLDKLLPDIHFKNSSRTMRRSSIIRALINSFKGSEFDITNFENEEELERYFIERFHLGI